MTSIKILHSKLKKYEAEDKVVDSPGRIKGSFNYNNSSNKFKSTTFLNSRKIPSSSSPEKKLSNQSVKKPCSLCEKRGFSERFHPESSCWYKDKGSSIQKSVNNVELSSSTFSTPSSLSSDEDLKN